jgi:hypothetical protein
VVAVICDESQSHHGPIDTLPCSTVVFRSRYENGDPLEHGSDREEGNQWM